MLCKACVKKNNAILDAVDLSNCEDREEKDAQLPDKESGKRKKTSKSKKTSKFKVGDYVLSQFPGYGDDWFQCEVYGKYRGKYNVYFLIDGAVSKGVEEDTLREPGAAEWTKLKRTDFLQKPFNRSGQQWQAVEIGKARKINKYKCEPVSSDEEAVWLDVSQVQKVIRSTSSS